MARLLGAWGKPWCPSHRVPAGRDCPDSAPDKRQQRKRERDLWRREAAEECPTYRLPW